MRPAAKLKAESNSKKMPRQSPQKLVSEPFVATRNVPANPKTRPIACCRNILPLRKKNARSIVKNGLVFTMTELTLAETKDSPTYQNPKKKVDEVIPKTAINKRVFASFGNDLFSTSDFLLLEYNAYSENGTIRREPSAARKVENAMGGAYLSPNLTAVKLDPNITTTESSRTQ